MQRSKRLIAFAFTVGGLESSDHAINFTIIDATMSKLSAELGPSTSRILLFLFQIERLFIQNPVPLIKVQRISYLAWPLPKSQIDLLILNPNVVL